MSLKVVTFSSGTGFAPVILAVSLSDPYFCKYSFASLQSSKVVIKQTSDPSLLINSVYNACPASSESTASIIFSLSSK
jgi:hypothetical protein